MNRELIDRMLYEIETKSELFHALEQISDEETLLELARNYNWDDGFEMPYRILKHKHCSLAVALELFYDADGEIFLCHEDHFDEEWHDFVDRLYQQIISHDFPVGKCSFEVPLTKVEKFKLKKLGVDEIFIKDI